MSKVEEELRMFATLMSASQQSHSIYGLILDHGVPMPDLATTKSYKAMPRGQCFKNCFMHAEDHAGLTYVEGFADFGVIALHHAWLLNKKGQVVDPTWRDLIEMGCPMSYYGIPLKHEYVRSVAFASGIWGVLDNPHWRRIYTDDPASFVKEVQPIKEKE